MRRILEYVIRTSLNVWIACILTAFAALAFAQAPAGDAAPEAAGTPPPPTATAAARVALPSGANVAVIPVHGMIYDFTHQSLERRIDRALQQGASLIVLELDTPGGLVTSALDISKYLKTVRVPTIAWVNNDAYSAGIIIGSACDQIVMSPASATGDAAPISLAGNLSATERAKALSPILEEFRDNATSNNYPFVLFHAMTVLGVEVYQIQNPDTGEKRLVNQADYGVMVLGQELPGVAINNPNASGAAAAPATPAAEELAVAAPTVMEATPADQGKWTLAQRVHDGKTLLTLNQTRALDVGLSSATVGSLQDIQNHLRASSVWRVEQTWSEDLAAWAWFLTHPLAKGALMVLLLAGLYIELQAPGFGVGGVVALLALALLLGAPLVVGLAEWWHLIAFGIGLLLLIVELAFLPGFGLIGVAGIVLMFIGLVFAGVPTSGGSGPVRMPAPEMWSRVLLSLVTMVTATIACTVGFFFVAQRYGRTLPVFSRLILDSPTRPALAGAEIGGATYAPADAHVSGAESVGLGLVRIGDTGTVVSELRPTGRAEFAGHLIDVTTPGYWITRGKTVKVTQVRGNLVTVEEA